jgi:4-amino-4-deoxy-L-arabinose transferase-like glycosyltransferase
MNALPPLAPGAAATPTAHQGPLPNGPAWLAAALLMPLWWLLALSAAPLFDVDEGAFAEASRQMLTSGDWGHTMLGGIDRFDKPVFSYWLQAAALALFGAGEFAVRLPSALAAAAWCLAVGAFAATRWGARCGWLAAAMLATSFGPLLIGRAATADALLNLWLTLAALDLWRFVEGGGMHRAPLRRAALWIALGLLTKGPVALLVPGAAVLLWLALPAQGGTPQPPARLALLRRLLCDAAAWGVLAAVALPWYLYALVRHGGAFIEGFLIRHNVERFAAPMEGHGGGWLYYLVALPLLLLPWSVLLPALLARARRVWREPLGRYLLLWCCFVVVFFSLSGTKLPHYVLYGSVPLLLLLVPDVAAAGLGALAAVSAAAGASLAAAAAAPQWAALAAAHPAVQGHWAELLAAAAGAQPPAAGALWALLPVPLLLAAWAWRAPARRGPAMVAAAALAGAAWTLAAIPWWGQALQAPVRDLSLLAAERGLPLVQWRLHQPSAAFYRGQVSPRAEPQPGEAALMRHDRWQELPEGERAGFELLARAPGFVLVLRR